MLHGVVFSDLFITACKDNRFFIFSMKSTLKAGRFHTLLLTIEDAMRLYL